MSFIDILMLAVLITEAVANVYFALETKKLREQLAESRRKNLRKAVHEQNNARLNFERIKQEQKEFPISYDK